MTQDSTEERRRKHMAVMDDKEKGTKAMTAPEKIWVQWPQENGTGLAFTCQARPPALRQGYTRTDIAQAAVDRIENLTVQLQMVLAREVETQSACDYADEVKVVADHIGELRTLLSDDLYDSKDWRHADLKDRVTWLITMLANKNQEIDLWASMCAAASEDIEDLNAKLAKAVEAAFCEGFAEGYDGTWVEGDYTHAWKESEAFDDLGKTK